MSASLRDPLFTARLEPALTILANQPTRALHYLEDRFELESGELQEWLAEFNGGSKALKFERVHEVKRALAQGQPVPAFVPPPAPSAPVAEYHERGPKGERQEPAPLPPEPETPAAAARRETMQRAGRRPKSVMTARPATVAVMEEVFAKPAREEIGKTILTPAPARPWLKKNFRGLTFHRWRAVLLEFATPGRVATEVCARHKKSCDALYMYVRAWLGCRIGQLTPALVTEFITWGDAKCMGLTANPPRGKRAAAEEEADERRSKTLAPHANGAAPAAGAGDVAVTTRRKAAVEGEGVTSLDRELAALRRCVEVLENVPAEHRVRIVRTAAILLGVELPV